jgi:hypothetical protein
MAALGAFNVPQRDFGVAAIWAVLLLTNAFGLPVDESDGRFRRVVNKDPSIRPRLYRDYILQIVASDVPPLFP